MAPRGRGRRAWRHLRGSGGRRWRRRPRWPGPRRGSARTEKQARPAPHERGATRRPPWRPMPVLAPTARPSGRHPSGRSPCTPQPKPRTQPRAQSQPESPRRPSGSGCSRESTAGGIRVLRLPRLPARPPGGGSTAPHRFRRRHLVSGRTSDPSPAPPVVLNCTKASFPSPDCGGRNTNPDGHTAPPWPVPR